MTIDEAIAQLKVQLEGKQNPRQKHQAAAIELAIQALKRELENRGGIQVEYLDLLPGESLGDMRRTLK